MVERALPLFAYQTLTEPGTLDRLLGRSAERTIRMAELQEHEKVWMPEFDYPFAVPKPGSHVIGRLIDGLSAADYLKLDEYEAVAEGDYCRVTVRVRPQGMGPLEPVDAYVYLRGPRWEPKTDGMR